MTTKTFTKRFWTDSFVIIFTAACSIFGFIGIIAAVLAISFGDHVNQTHAILSLLLVVFPWIFFGIIYCICVFFRAMRCGTQ